MITYFDNASTSWPKPTEVRDAIVDGLEAVRGNPGRTGSGQGDSLVAQTRRTIASFFNIGDPHRVIFTSNASGALNLAIQGFVRPGDRVVMTSLEHNSVLRPVRYMASRQVRHEVLWTSPDGFLDPDDLRKALQTPTQLVAIGHASNVLGSLQDISVLSRIVHEHGARLLLDASQSAGVVPIDVARDQIDMLACPGHKNLLGPAGTGFLYVSPEIELEPILYGGTGNLSHLELMPPESPERYEPGTLNFHGLAGLKAGIEYLVSRGIDTIQQKESQMTRQMLDGLRGVQGIVVHGPRTASGRLPVFSITLPNCPVTTLGSMLEERFGVVTRVGLHCAPLAHRTAGTFPDGTVRLSPGLFHSEDDIAHMLWCLTDAVRELGADKRARIDKPAAIEA